MNPKLLTLKMKEWLRYETTSKGVFIFTEHDFRIFISNELLTKINKTKERYKE